MNRGKAGEFTVDDIVQGVIEGALVDEDLATCDRQLRGESLFHLHSRPMTEEWTLSDHVEHFLLPP